MTLRCGVAGLGRGKYFVKQFDGIPGCEVVAVCDPSPVAMKAYGQYACFTDFDTFIREAGLDVAAIITPGPVHASQSLLALEHGAHVLCETPCVYSLDEAEQIVAAVRKTGLKYMLTEDYVYRGCVQRWKAIADSGALGDIVYAEGEYTHDCRNIMFVDGSGRYVPFQERGQHRDVRLSWRARDLPPLKYCSHTLGPLLHLMNDRCVSAVGMATGSKTLPEVPSDDVMAGILKTEKGAVIRLTTGFSIAQPMTLTFNLIGTRGALRASQSAETGVKLYTDDQAEAGWQDLDMEWSGRDDGRDWVTVMIEEFIDSVRRDEAPPIDVFRSMDYTVPGICACMSAERDGEPVAVPDFRESLSAMPLCDTEQPER